MINYPSGLAIRMFLFGYDCYDRYDRYDRYGQELITATSIKVNSPHISR